MCDIVRTVRDIRNLFLSYNFLYWSSGIGMTPSEILEVSVQVGKCLQVLLGLDSKFIFTKRKIISS